MSLSVITGIALVLSSVIYHAGLAYVFARAEFGEVLKLSHRERPSVIARHPSDYRRGCHLILLGWIVAAMGYVMLAAILHDTGDPIVSTLAASLFLIAIALAGVFWAFHVPLALAAAAEAAQASSAPAYYDTLQVAAESSLRVYLLLGLAATAGFGWALLQTGLVSSWVGWATLGWGVVWTGVCLMRSEGIPLLPMVMQVVIGLALILR